MNRIGILGAAVVAGWALVSCGEPQEVSGSGTIGTNAEVGDVKLRNVFVEAPGGNGYRPGDDAVVRLAMLNASDEADALMGVRTGHASDVELRSDEDCDGTAETVPRLPVPAADSGAEPGTPDLTYHLRIVDLTEEVQAGTTVPLTFTFDKAGEITVDAMVEATDDGDVPPTPNCPTAPAR